MDVTAHVPLIFFILVLIIYLAYTFIIIYHLARFGVGTKPKIAALVFFAGALLLLVGVAVAYWQLDATTLTEKLKNVNFHF